MKIALASDHGGFALKEQVKEHLLKREIEVIDLGTNSEDSVDYPAYMTVMVLVYKQPFEQYQY